MANHNDNKPNEPVMHYVVEHKVTGSLTLSLSGQDLSSIITTLATINTKLDKIMLTQADFDILLGKVDTTTNKIAANVQLIADTDQVISDEIDKFLAATPVGTVLTQEQADKLQAAADKLQASSDASDTQVNVLKAIAAKGAPVVPPPPTTVLQTNFAGAPA